MKLRLWLALLILSATGMTQEITLPPSYSDFGTAITTSGGSVYVQNRYIGTVASFEEIVTGAPDSVSITVQGCMPNGTCDTAADTNTTVGTTIRHVTFTNAYSKFKITATWVNGTNVSVQTGFAIAKGGGGGSAPGGAAGGVLSGTYPNPGFAAQLPASTFAVGTAAAPVINFTGFTNYGLHFDGTFGLAFDSNGAESGGVLGDGLWAGARLAFGAAGASPDTGISRDAAGVIDIGTGATGSKAGSLKLAGITGTGALDFSASGATINLPTDTPVAEGRIGENTTQHTVVAYEGSTGSAQPFVRVGPCLPQLGSSDTITASVVNTTPTAFATNCKIPANFFIAHKTIRVTVGMSIISTATIPTFSAQLKTCTISGCATGTVVTLYTSSAQAPPASASAAGGGAVFMIQGTAAAGASVNVQTDGVTFAPGVNSTVCSPFCRNTVANPVAIATNADEYLTVFMTFSSNAATNGATLTSLYVEEVD